tara:strand:- start:1149 stop:1409 length:261 start_codon:yes stop_codon:yes gene_type:complete
MIDNLKLKSDQAQQLLNNPAYKNAVEAVKNSQIQRFLSSSQDDTKTREEVHSIILALSALEYELVSAISDQVINERKTETKKRNAP